MRLKFILNSDAVKNISSIISFFAKHTDRIVLIFSADNITILTHDNNLWATVDIKRISDLYLLEGHDCSVEEENFIYMDVKSSSATVGFESFSRGDSDKLDVRLCKTNYPYLKLSAVLKEGMLCIEIPAIIIPREKWHIFERPVVKKFDVKCNAPRYEVLKKYIDIYKSFIFCSIVVRMNSMVIESGSEISSRITTVFENVVTEDSRSNEFYGIAVEVRMEAKRLSHFLHSISNLNLQEFNIICCIQNNKLIKFNFLCYDDAIDINFTLPNVEKDSAGNGIVSEEENDDDNDFIFT